MPDRIGLSSSEDPPQWAVDRAADEVDDVGAAVLDRARAIVVEDQAIHDERHDEYDDPDQGGEA